MKITIDIPLVNECAISDCAYNMDDMCHAKAITIGDGMHPGCDTSFFNHRSMLETQALRRVLVPAKSQLVLSILIWNVLQTVSM